MSWMFSNWSSLIIAPDLSWLDTTNVTNLSGCLSYWSALLTPPNLDSFVTSSATMLYDMMSGWEAMLTPPDVSSFDTSNVTGMDWMMDYWTAMGEIDIDIDLFDITSLTSADSMLNGTTLTTACYDRVLIAWAAQVVKPNVTVHFGSSKYTSGGAAEAARDILSGQGWTITDGGGI